MRVWTIALLSVLVGVVAAAASAAPGISVAASSDIVPRLLLQSPSLTVVALASYAFAVVLLTTGTLVNDIITVRGRLARLAKTGIPARDDIVAAFVGSRLVRFARPAPPLPCGATPSDGVVWTLEIVTRGEFRGEATRLHYIWLARVQFFTVLVLLAVIAALGFVQDYSTPLISLPGIIPSRWTVLALGALILLGGLCRLLIDVTVEPVVQELVEITGERPETRLLRRITEMLEEARATVSAAALGQAVVVPAPRPVSDELIERLAKAVDESRLAWLNSVAKLTAAAATLQGIMTVSAQSLASLAPVLERVSSMQSSTNPGTFDASNFVELQGAVERLTIAIERFGRLSEETAGEGPPAKTALARGGGAVNGIAAELAKLLRELNAKS